MRRSRASPGGSIAWAKRAPDERLRDEELGAVKLSILMPVFNEEKTVTAAIKRVLDVPWPCEVELVVVEDGSTDDTAAVLDGIDDP